MADLLDDQGNIYYFEVFKNKFGVRGTIMFFQSLIRKIPNRWKKKSYSNKDITIANKLNVKCNIYVQFLLKYKKDAENFMI